MLTKTLSLYWPLPTNPIDPSLSLIILCCLVASYFGPRLLLKRASVSATSSGAARCVYAARILTTYFRQQTSFISLPHFLKKRARAWAYLLDGPGIIRHAFNQVRATLHSSIGCIVSRSAKQSNGTPFEIFAPDARMVFVSSPKHVKELDNAPDTVLSLNGAAKHVSDTFGLLSQWTNVCKTDAPASIYHERIQLV